MGLLGSAFVDFGYNFEIVDQYCESKEINFITSISNAQEATVTCEKRVGGTYSHCRISEVEGMEELNSKIFKFEPHQGNVRLQVDSTNFSKYIRGGILQEVAMPENISFRPFEDCLSNPQNPDTLEPLMDMDFAKFGRINTLHACISAFYKFFEAHKHLP